MLDDRHLSRTFSADGFHVDLCGVESPESLSELLLL